MTEIHTPHDKLFRYAMDHKWFAVDFFKQHLPESVLKLLILDESHIHIKKDTFVDASLEAQMSDLVYEVKMREGREAVICFIVEHESTPKRFSSLRLLSYYVSVCFAYKNQGRVPFPLIMPMLFYHGDKSPYPHSLNVFDLFESPDLARELFNQGFGLADLTVKPDEELRQYKRTALFHQVLKHIRSRDLLLCIEDFFSYAKMREAKEICGEEFVITVVQYVKDQVGEQRFYEEFREMAETSRAYFKKRIEEGLAAYARELGIQQGKAEGKAEGIEQVARTMLQAAMNLQLIQKSTGLSEAVLQRIQQELLLSQSEQVVE